METPNDKEAAAKAALAAKRAAAEQAKANEAPNIPIPEPSIAAKLLWVQRRLCVLKNRGKGHTPNTQVTYEYRNAEDILEAVKPLCEEVGALVTVTVRPEIIGINAPVEVREVKSGGTDKYGNQFAPTYARLFGPRFVAVATAQFRDCNGKGEVIECSAFAEIDFWRKGQTEPEKLCGSADSYACKYALGHLFALDNNRDADMESDTPTATAVPPPSF